MTQPFTLDEAEAFWAQVDITGEDKCWLWRGQLDPRRRIPNLHVNGNKSSMTAVRFAYITSIGPINGDVWISRDRNNPNCHDHIYCLNPNHMILRMKKPRPEGAPKYRKVHGRKHVPTGIEPTYQWLYEHRNFQRESIASFLGYNVDQVAHLLNQYGIKPDGKHFLEREFDGGDKPYTPINHDCDSCGYLSECTDRSHNGNRLMCEGKIYSIPEEKEYYDNLIRGNGLIPIGNFALLWSLITA